MYRIWASLYPHRLGAHKLAHMHAHTHTHTDGIGRELTGAMYTEAKISYRLIVAACVGPESCSLHA